MIDISTSIDFLTQEGRNRHQTYMGDASSWRLAAVAEPRRAPARSGTLLERIGAALISTGRRLCERRGAIVVDVSFRSAQSRNSCDAA